MVGERNDGDDRPLAYWEETAPGIWVAVFRASGLGGACTKALVALLSGWADDVSTTTPPALERAFAEGHWLEEDVLRRFYAGTHHMNAGSKVGVKYKSHDNDLDTKIHANDSAQFPYVTGRDTQTGQWEVEIPVGKRAVIRAHLDDIGQVFALSNVGEAVHLTSGTTSILSLIGSRAVIEAKAFGPDYMRRWKAKGLTPEAFPAYAWQATIAMRGTGLPVWMVVGEKERDADDDAPEAATIKGVDCQLITEMPVPWGKVMAKVMRVLAMYDRAVEEGWRDWSELPACDVAMYPCPFWHIPGHGDDVRTPAVVDVEVLSEMKPAIEVLDAAGLAGIAETAALVKTLELEVANYNEYQRAESHAKANKKAIAKVIAGIFDALGRKGKKVRVGDWEVEDYVKEVEESVVTFKARTDRYPKVKRINDKDEGKD